MSDANPFQSPLTVSQPAFPTTGDGQAFQGPPYAPGWAVGYFFIPILNLFRPYQVAKEVAEGSDPASIGDVSSQPNVGQKPPIGVWWTMWIITGLLSQSAAVTTAFATPLRVLLVCTQVSIIAELVAIPSILYIVDDDGCPAHHCEPGATARIARWRRPRCEAAGVLGPTRTARRVPEMRGRTACWG
jgi:hypothetical protein